MNWWKQIFAKILVLLGRQPAQLPAGKASATDMRQDAEDLPEDLRVIVAELEGQSGVVVDTVAQALRDFRHLRQVMMGPGASADAVDDVTLIAEAQALLHALVLRAPEVKTLAAIATTRKGDKAGRSAAGDAVLSLRDQGRVLHELASAALQWASSRSEADRKELQARAQRLTG